MRGTELAVKYYEKLLSELQQRIANKVSAVLDEKHRLYWEGMPLWFKLKGMAEMFANFHCTIVASTYCNSWVFDDLSPEDPFRSSALAYTKLFIARSDEEKEKTMAALLKDYTVNGVIYHDAKTCPRNSNNHYGLQKRLYQKSQIPYLEIQGDLNDSRCFSDAQSSIAIETFIKQLEMKSECIE
jgi:benzoyl-CoA reductase/2-hydroxyglutaryl-CoA dehydratase subunit BcrC/BadD/HgdB